MKKLTLLITMLMATSAWGEIVNLSCEADTKVAVDRYGNYSEVPSLGVHIKIDTRNKKVEYKNKVTSQTKFAYKEENEVIKWKVSPRLVSCTKHDFSLDRVSGRLIKEEVNFECRDKGVTSYQCTKSEGRLF